MKRLTVVIVWVAAIGSFWRWNSVKMNLEVGSIVAIEYKVVDWPKERWGRQIIRIRNITATLPKGTKITYGDRVKLIGSLDSRMISKSNDYFNMNVRSVNILQENNTQLYFIQDLRTRMKKLILGWLPGDLASLAIGILLGGSEELSEETKNGFKRVGMTHVLAASGYNVGVVSGWVMGMGWRWWGKRRSIPFVIFCIILYMLLAGGSAAVVRAGLMAIMTMIALSIGRGVQAGWILILIVGMILVVKPEWWGDIGFQLSVAAMAGLIWIEPKLPGKMKDLKTTVAAWIATTPIILHYFGNMSVVAPIVNGILLWTIPPIMQITALAVGIGLFWEGAGWIIMMLGWPLLSILIGVTNFVGKQGWSAMEVGELSWGWVILYYLTLTLVINYQLAINKINIWIKIK